MTDYAGIQAATATLRRVLLERSRFVTSVTTTPPDVEDSDADPPVANLFLFRVSQSPALKNQDLPGRSGPASLGRPPLSLDLHYLLTTTGQTPEDALGAQEALGDAMLVLHDHPVIAKDDPLLDPALEHEVELLKVTLDDVDTGQLAELWSATTAPYRLAVAYRVTVVQLESTRPRSIAKPVGEPPEAGPRVHALLLDRPVITDVAVIRALPDGSDGPEQPLPYARLGDRLVATGSGFIAGTRMRLGPVTVDPEPASTPLRTVVTVPGGMDLRPGVHSLQAVRDALVGEPPDERSLPALQSNVAAFVLVPAVTSATVAGTGDDVEVTVHGTALDGRDYPTFVLLGDVALQADRGATGPTEVTVPAAQLAPGSYPVRVRVAGAESLETDVEVAVP